MRLPCRCTDTGLRIRDAGISFPHRLDDCVGINLIEQFMADGTAFHGDLEMEERIERDFSVTGKINSGTFTEVFTVLVHFFNFRQQDLFDFFRIGHSVHPLVKSDIIF